MQTKRGTKEVSKQTRAGSKAREGTQVAGGSSHRARWRETAKRGRLGTCGGAGHG